jgi:uncharacterized protein (TIGR02145 family)
LTANHATATSFIWYKNGVQILGASSQSYVATELGAYCAKAVVGGCVSDFSNERIISVASASGAEVTIQGSLLNLEVGQTRTYTAVMDNPQGATYNWTVTNATLTSGQGTNQITVNFHTAANASISLEASNACGPATVTGAGSLLTLPVTNPCKSPTSFSYNPSSKNVSISSGSSTNLSVTASGGTAPYSYQWHKPSSANNTISSPVSGATSATYSTPPTPNSLAAGTHYYYAVASPSCGGNSLASDIFTVTVKDMSSIPNYTGGGTFSGKTCFDIVATNPGGSCGATPSRTNDKYSFTATPTQVYTFAPPGGVTVSNVKFEYYNLNTTPVIQSLSPNNYQVTVTFNTGLNTQANGLTRANALKATLYVLFTVNSIEYKLSLTLNVADCACCPGLLIPNGAWTVPATVSSLPSASTTAVNSNTAAASITATLGQFTKAGQDLCYYYRDYSATANSNNGDYGTWNSFTNSGANMSYVCGANDGKGVDTDHASSSWRLPNIAELAQIGQLVSNGTHGDTQTSQLTQSMVNDRINATSTNGQLPAGSAVIGATVYNLRQASYWSSTSQDATYAWRWNYNQPNRRAYGNTKSSSGGYVRCVRSY